MDEYLTPEEVAEILKVSEKVVKDWLRAGTIPGTKIGKLWRVPKAELETWLESNTQKPKPSNAD
jgi:excisionase family DNA binding protein